ncbi:hypothetical protein [Tepidiphilus olei]|uniref:hypothetical protein n=1 Tax=Tepidiphilus olei TaxID=2502184 RepID=UPI00163DBA4F|nr:hypothetical protein [Tepidiphilus olei]
MTRSCSEVTTGAEIALTRRAATEIPLGTPSQYGERGEDRARLVDRRCTCTSTLT